MIIFGWLLICICFMSADESYQKCSSRILCWASKANISNCCCKATSASIHISKFWTVLSHLVYWMRMFYFLDVSVRVFLGFANNITHQITEKRYVWKFQGRTKAFMTLVLASYCTHCYLILGVRPSANKPWCWICLSSKNIGFISPTY